jgi:hypothetical protein
MAMFSTSHEVTWIHHGFSQQNRYTLHKRTKIDRSIPITRQQCRLNISLSNPSAKGGSVIIGF